MKKEWDSGRFAARRRAWVFGLVVAMILPAAAMAQPGSEREPSVDKSQAKPTPILPLNEVRIGMKGYGLTVFAGAKIEPFPVEVISVMRDFAPKHGVVWIRCDDERLKKTGPVSGMSGSPIYLWSKDEPHELGKGGKLIGAFAFGYSWTKECYAGVQSIEAMRGTGDRLVVKKNDDGHDSAHGAAKPKTSAPAPGQTLIDLLRLAKTQGWSEQTMWRTQALAKLVGVKPATLKAPASTSELSIPYPKQWSGQPMRLMLPLTVRSSATAQWLTPLLEPMGIRPLEAPIGAAAGMPPPGIDPKSIKLEPGSVMAIPLAFGDADLSATGTVTDVLPDGRVLAFGHAMFGEGESAVPMASGYVHFIVPRAPGSFKLGGSAVIKGAILRDEAVGIAGDPKGSFSTAKVNITVNFDGRSKKYTYDVVQHDRLTPTLAATVAMQSLSADLKLPAQNTVRLDGQATFAGHRKLIMRFANSPAAESRLMVDLMPPIATMIQNPHETMMLESLDLTFNVVPRIEAVALVSARLDKAVVEPGEQAQVIVRLQPYGKKPTTKRVSLKVPVNLPDGRYRLTVGDARSYGQRMLQNRPHLMITASGDDVFQTVRMLTQLRDEALYLVLQLPQSGIALGRQELPRLPSSRRALIAASPNALAVPIADWVEKVVPMGAVVSGELALQLEVRRHGGAAASP